VPALLGDTVTLLQGYKFGDISRKLAVDVKLGAEEVKKGFESVVQRVTKNEVRSVLRSARCSHGSAKRCF
jgi:hypothetical protein